PLAGAERGGAVVAGAGVDLVQDDHSPSPQPREYQSARTMKISAKNWRMTRACISLFEVLPEPPRIMLMSPRASTITTATMNRMAMMLKSVDMGCGAFRAACRGRRAARPGILPFRVWHVKTHPSHIRRDDTIGGTMLRILAVTKRVLGDALGHFNNDDGWAIASHLALSALLALFPFLIFATSLASFLGARAFADTAVHLVFDTWPDEIAEPIAREVTSVLTVPRGDVLTFGILITAYFASNGIEALRVGL